MPTFDVVSEVDMQEVRNAIDQANREIGTRFDFKGSDTRVEQAGAELTVLADSEFRIGQAREILRQRLAKRGIDLSCLAEGPVEAVGGDRARQKITVRQGIEADLARKLVRLVKDSRLKVQAQIMGEQVRVSGKKRDDLQAVIALLRGQDHGIPLQFTNFRD